MQKNNYNFRQEGISKDSYKPQKFKENPRRSFSHANHDMEKQSEQDSALIVGRNPVMEALKSDTPIDVLYVMENAGGSVPKLCAIARERGVVVKQVSEQKLSQLCGGASHQGVIASGACGTYVEVEDILSVSKQKNTAPFLIICDEIEDPHNLGAILRSAEAAGADGVIIPKRRSASLNQTVYKTSAGAASWVKVARVSNIASTLDMLKQKGVWIYGTEAAGESYVKCDFTGAVALVIGSEGKGISRLVREKCDFLTCLPMCGNISSLNASVAAGIFMYEVVRQRAAR